MLMNNNLAAKQFAEYYERCVFQEAHAVAGDCQIAGIVMMGEQFPQDGKVAADKTEYLFYRPFAYLIHAARRRKIDIIAMERVIDQAAVLDVLAHHGGAMYRRGQWSDKKNSIFHILLI